MKLLINCEYNKLLHSFSKDIIYTTHPAYIIAKECKINKLYTTEPAITKSYILNEYPNKQWFKNKIFLSCNRIMLDREDFSKYVPGQVGQFITNIYDSKSVPQRKVIPDIKFTSDMINCIEDFDLLIKEHLNRYFVKDECDVLINTIIRQYHFRYTIVTEELYNSIVESGAKNIDDYNKLKCKIV